jgi:hypothetical protein
MKRILFLLLVAALLPVQFVSGFIFDENMPPDRLTESAKQAILAAPRWVRQDLESNFKRMEPEFQDIYADMILNPSESRFRDEIAFCVANIGVANLQSPDFIPDLLEENVFYIYEHEQYLDYVDIVNAGNPDEDDNYYSTTVYWVEEDGDRVEYILPKDIYYWNIVHPKIDDEQAFYIDPDAVGGVPAPPPTGVFWRNWLFTITEPIGDTSDYYPILRDSMAGVDVLWGNTTTGAIGALGTWIRATMDFTSGQERPIQPVRIYTLHVGRCGEYQDYTSAAARACLIPVLNTMAVGEDHVWNEFWHQRWIHWEPVNGDGYIDNPMVYEDGWGKEFTGVFNVAGDGWTWDVIDRYSNGYCHVSATVLDANGDPVDGARLALRDGGWPSAFGFAGSDGEVTAMYGDNVKLEARINSELGRLPEATWHEIVDVTVDGEHYHWTAQYPDVTIPQIPWTPVVSQGNATQRLSIHFNVTGEMQSGYYNYDKQNIYSRFAPEGSVDMFIVDAYNYDLYRDGHSFEVHHVISFAENDSVVFDLPYTSKWTVVFSAERKLTSETHVSVTIQLNERQGQTWDVLTEVERDVSLLPGDVYSASIVAGDSSGTDLGVGIVKPSAMFRPGDPCSAAAYVFNADQMVQAFDIPFFVILDVYGEYFFAPEFNEFSHYTIPDLQSAESHRFQILPEFAWPQNAGAADGIIWYAAMTDPQITSLFGPLAYFEFGWEE